MDKSYIKLIIGLLFLSVVLIGFAHAMNNIIDGIDGDCEKCLECSSSQYNKYSNSTEARYSFGKCYIRTFDCWQTRKVCTGIIFPSCYESDDSHTDCAKKTVCFKLKTGERC